MKKILELLPQAYGKQLYPVYLWMFAVFNQFLVEIAAIFDLPCFLVVVFLVLVPGLRKHGILQKVTGQVSDAMSKLLKKKEKASSKTKTN